MARNGSGTYSRTQSDYTFNTVIQETQINSELNDIATELTNSIDKDGQTPITGILKHSVTVGQTANTGSVQGNNPITTEFYEIATCANPGDAVTLPTAVAGQLVIIVNNGAQSADVFPASGDKIDGGSVNVAFALAAGANALFICQDGTDWDTLGGGFFTPSSTTTLSAKTIDLDANTLTGTLAEFNSALQSESFCSLTGSESLTNKTLNSPIINDPAFDVSVGNTANTGSVQGNNPITSFLYEIATCANPGDAVTLPNAVAGLMVIVANNGAESADVFPASGDKIDGGSTNAAYALASATNTIFICQDATDWDTVSGGGGTSNNVVDTMTGDGSDTTLALSQDPGSENNVTVTMDGVTQHHGTFSVSGTTLTFSTAPATGVLVEAVSGAADTVGAPSDGSVSEAKLGSSSVTTAKIANNAVDETKLKDALIGDFTDATVTASDTFLYGDATDSGNTKRDTVQGILDLASGGAFTLIATSLISTNTSSITLTGMSSTYSSYMLTFSDIIGSANNSEIRLRVGDASAIDAGLGDYSWHSTTKDANGGSQSSTYGNDGWWALSTSSTGKDGTEVSGGIIYFHNSPSVGASRRLMMSGTYVFCDSAGTSATIGHSIIGHYDGGVTVDRVNFEFAGQNVASGRMSLYGIAHA